MWTMLNNGVCPPEISKLELVEISSGYATHMAIDNNGRLYTWGSSSWQYGGQTPVSIPSTPNFNRNPVTYRSSDGYLAMVYPYQVGIKDNWVKCRHIEYVYIAMDSDGYLYAWGEDDGFGVGGWGPTEQYVSSPMTATTPFVPGGSQAITPQLINNVKWLDFAAGQYHVLGLKADNTLWIWGTNLAGLTYGSASYAEDYVSLDPIHVSWVPGAIKLVSADYKVNAVVTTTNQIYAWGDWANSRAPEATPTLRNLAVPAGVIIVDIDCSRAGIVVLLSNGDVYVQGYAIAFTTPPAEQLDFIKAPGEHFFTKIRMFDLGVMALDNLGNIWAWGDQANLALNEFSAPVMVATGNSWKNMSAGANCHLAIDTEGRLFAWGDNNYGMLGIGAFQGDVLESLVPVQCNPITLDDGSLAYEQDAGTAAMQIVIPSPKQLSEHNPCGHWHKGVDTSDPDAWGLDIPECCWNFSVDISGNDVVLYALGIGYPWPTVALRYNVSTRVWYGPYWRTDNIYTSDWVAGASINGAFDGLMMYCGDVTGTVLGGTVSDLRVTIKTTNHPTGEIYERHFPSAPPQNCEGKIVVSGAGTVAVLIEMPSSIQLWYSIDYGRTFALGEEWSYTGQYRYSRIVREGATYYVAIFYADGVANGQIRTYRSTNVLDWTPCAIVSTAIPATRFNMFASANNVYLLCHNQLFYSTDSATSFTSRSTTNVSNLGAVNGVDLDVLIFYVDRLEKTLDYTVTDPVWGIYPIIPDIRYLLDDFTMVRGSGNNVIFMHDNLFVTKRIVLPVSQNLGETWELVPTAINHYETIEESFHGRDDPRWKFSQQRNIVDLDPQYK